MRVLVTGGAGNIGLSLIDQLISEKIETVLFDLPEQLEVSKSRINSNTETFHGSILDKSKLSKAIKGCTHVVHLAAVLGVQNTEADKAHCLEINILGTQKTLNACIDEKVSKFIFASSSETYGEPIKTPINEDSITQGKTVYAVSKLAGEEFVKAYSQKFSFLNYSILRFFNVFGPNQVGQFVISKFINNAKQNKPIVINGDGKQQRAYCYVDDAVRGILMALQSEKANSEVINIGNSSNLISINDLARMICRIINVDDAIITNDLKFENTDRKQEREIFKRYPDTNKAKLLLDFEAEVGLEEALKKVVKNANYIKSWPKKELSD